MTIHVNIGEAKTRLSELIAAAVRGEEVILDKAGEPQVRLTPVNAVVDSLHEKERERIAESRRSAIGMFRHKYGETLPDLDVRAMKPTDAEWEEHYRRKFGGSD